MAAAEAWLAARGIAKLNLLVRAGNEAVVGFYEALGYAVEPRVALAKRLDGTAFNPPTASS
jgi:ribosomal protein S18 acetylase RimI-like enzyme